MVEAGPAIFIGIVFGVQATNKNRVVSHLNDAHKVGFPTMKFSLTC